MYCGPIFRYNPKNDAYEHPIYCSVSKTSLVAHVKSKMDDKMHRELETLLREIHEIYESNLPGSDLLIYKRTIGRRMSTAFPAIEVLALAAETCPELIERIWGPKNPIDYVLRQTITAFQMQDGLRIPIVGHLLLSDVEDLILRFHLLLLLGMDLTEIHYAMVLCKRCNIEKMVDKRTGKLSKVSGVVSEIAISDVALNFTILMSLMFDMGMKPCNILRANIAKFPRFVRPFIPEDKWRDFRLPNDHIAGLGLGIAGWCVSCEIHNNVYYVDDEMIHDIYVRHVTSQTLFDKLCTKIFPRLKK